MPRAKQRRRIVICDCRDCVDVAQGPVDYSWEPAARQLPPPRSLILLLEGFNADPSTSSSCCRVDEVTLPHFDNVARKGLNFCVAIPSGAQSELPSRRLVVFPAPLIAATTPTPLPPPSNHSHTSATSSSSAAEARLQLPHTIHDTSEVDHRSPSGHSAPPSNSACSTSTLSTVAPTICSSAAVPGGHAPGEEAPCVTLPLPPAEQVAARVAELLHLQQRGNASVPLRPIGGSSTSDALGWVDPNLDVLVLHVKADDLCKQDEPGSRGGDMVRRAGLAWADSLLKTLASSTAMHDSILLHLLVSFSPGSQSSKGLRPGQRRESHMMIERPPGGATAGILSRVTRPKQSWQCSGLQSVKVDDVRPVAVASYLKGVTRQDDVDSFCLQDFLHRGGQGCILIDRMIHEIAYKVARALKFGS